MSPARRRRAVEHLQQVFGVSQRWACQLVGQHRSTQRHQPTEPDRDRALREHRRLLYVALTRARDRLYLCGTVTEGALQLQRGSLGRVLPPTLPALMEPGKVYTLKPTPIATSIQFGKGHRIRVEITSSNFPKFARNLNTGGPNETEREAVVADNAIHHSADNSSYIELPVVKR